MQRHVISFYAVTHNLVVHMFLFREGGSSCGNTKLALLYREVETSVAQLVSDIDRSIVVESQVATTRVNASGRSAFHLLRVWRRSARDISHRS